MKILHISGFKTWGGGENHLENLCFELKKNPDVENVIFCVQEGEFHQRLKNKDIPFVTAPLKNKMDPRFIFKLIRVAKKGEFDLLHIHDSTALTLSVIADHFTDLPPFIFSKKISFPVRRNKFTLFKYNYPKIAKYLCVSEQTKQVMAEAIEDQSKLTTIYHGTRLDTKSNITPYLLREKFSIPTTKIIVGNVANHHFSKDLDTFIDVADHLINNLKMNNFYFIQIGSFTKVSDPWLEKVKQLNLQNHFKFLGYEPNASNFIPQFDIFLLTSTNEGFPQVIYEAFYHEIPVVSTIVAGVPEVVQNEKNGLLAEKRDVTKLSEHVISLVENPDLIAKLTAQNKALVKEKFSTTQMAEKTLIEYKKISNGRFY